MRTGVVANKGLAPHQGLRPRGRAVVPRAEGGDGGMNEQMMERLRKAEEEAARLREVRYRSKIRTRSSVATLVRGRDAAHQGLSPRGFQPNWRDSTRNAANHTGCLHRLPTRRARGPRVSGRSPP